MTVAPGAALAVSVGGNNQWNASGDDIGVPLNSAAFNWGSAPGIDTTDATTPFTYSGSIGGGMGLVKLGPNTFIITASNSYTGGTVVEAGILVVANGRQG